MAHTVDDIDRRLAVQADAWHNVPQIAQAWPSMYMEEQTDYLIGWRPRCRTLAQLRALERAGAFTPAQQERFDQLRQLIERHQPTLESLFEGY